MNLFYVSVRKMSSNAARGADNYEAQQLYWYCGECGGAAGDIPSLSARRFFFRSLEGLPAQVFAPLLAFFLVLAAVLYALGREVLPRVIILCLFFMVLVFPVYAAMKCGLLSVLYLLRIGAWLLHLGLAVLVAEIFLPIDWLAKSRGNVLDNSPVR